MGLNSYGCAEWVDWDQDFNLIAACNPNTIAVFNF